jgi:tetratricopeptide (TPR) repeat protein
MRPLNIPLASLGLIALAFGPLQAPAGAAQAPATLEDVNHAAMEGRKLTDEDAAALEDAVKRDPNDVAARIKLLAYSMTRQDRPEIRKARQAHVLWLIENQPKNPVFRSSYAGLNHVTDGDAYYEAKKLWNKQVEANPNDAVILGNAAGFLLLGRKDEARALLERCVQLEPDNRHWHDRLAHLFSLESHGAKGDERKRLAARAVAEYERALARGPNDAEAMSLLINLAKSAYDAGEYEKAKGFATQVLDRAENRPKPWDSGQARHDGHLILGRLALVSGDVAEAKRHLLEAGKTTGSPVLGSFGPNMSLAKELLERGETETVIEYFNLCAKFWRNDRGRLKTWTDAAKAGIAPDFGANLVY